MSEGTNRAKACSGNNFDRKRRHLAKRNSREEILTCSLLEVRNLSTNNLANFQNNTSGESNYIVTI